MRLRKKWVDNGMNTGDTSFINGTCDPRVQLVSLRSIIFIELELVEASSLAM